MNTAPDAYLPPSATPKSLLKLEGPRLAGSSLGDWGPMFDPRIPRRAYAASM